MTAVQLVLLIAAAWVGLGLLVALVLLPLVRAGRWSDALVGHALAKEAVAGEARRALAEAARAPASPSSPADASVPAAASHRFARRPSLRVLRSDDPAVSLVKGSGYPGLVLERLVLHARAVFGADEVCVFGRDSREGRERLVLAHGVGVDPDLIGRRCFEADWPPVAGALAVGRPLAVPPALWPDWFAERRDPIPARSAAVAPIWFGGRIQGALAVVHRESTTELGVGGLALVGEVAQLVGQVLAHTEGRQLSAADPQPEIEGLLAALARVTPERGGHGDEVAEVASWLADDLGLGMPDRIELELAARLHDLGRLRVPSRILGSADGLSHAELELLRLQPVWGAEMVARIPGLEAVALIVRLTHERWDGRGYPDRLATEQIPLASRIVAVAEAYCAMTSRRVHAPALDGGTAARELQALAGTEFDPELVDRLTRIVGGAELRHRAEPEVPHPA